MFWLSLKFSLGCLCGGCGASSQNAASWELVCQLEFGAVLSHRHQKVNSIVLCFLYSVFWSQTMTLINGLTSSLLFYPGFLDRELFFWDGPLPLFTFFFSEFISWHFPYPKNDISGFRRDITVITCGSSFPILWDWDIKSKCSKLLLPLPWDHLLFQTVTINYLPWDVFTVHVP